MRERERERDERERERERERAIRKVVLHTSSSCFYSIIIYTEYILALLCNLGTI